MAKHGDEVHSITDAPQRHSEEQYARMMRYAYSQGIRMLCFILAAVTAIIWQSWWSMAFVVAAMILPYVAVVDANAGGDRYTRGRESDEVDPQARLTTGHQEPAEAPEWWEAEEQDGSEQASENGAAGTVIEGEIVRDDADGDR